MNLDALFNAKSIAIVGASSREKTVGNDVVKHLSTQGYQGKIIPVNPKIDELYGHKVYHDISEVDVEIDVVVIAIPAKFRRDLGKKAVITRGLDQCLFLYPVKEWEKLAKKLSQLPLSQSDARGFVRLMLGGAMEVSIDNLGRILVPDYLKDYASLKKKVVMIGLYDRVERWDETEFSKYSKKTEVGAGDMSERLKELGI